MRTWTVPSWVGEAQHPRSASRRAASLLATAGSSRSTRSLRYYEQAGLLAPAARVSGRRHYDDAVLGRLAVIGCAQDAGFHDRRGA